MDTQLPLTLAWDPSLDPGAVGYRLHYGTSSHDYTNVLDVGNVTTKRFYDLAPGVTNYFAVTAYKDGVESDFSNEIVAVAPSTGSDDGEFTLSITAPLSIALTAPVAGTDFASGAAVLLQSLANDPQRRITQVAYFYTDPLGAMQPVQIGVATNDPFALLWTNAPVGCFLVGVSAVDEFGASAVSPLVPVSVGAPPNDQFTNAIPLVGIPARASGSTVAAGKEPGEPDFMGGEPTSRTAWWVWAAPIDGRFSVTATAPNAHPIVGVFAGQSIATLLPQDTSISTHFDYSNGVFYCTTEARFDALANMVLAIAVDAQDQPFSLAITIPPVVELTTPDPGADFPRGANIFLQSFPLDFDGVINKVEYNYTADDGREGLIGIGPGISFDFIWTNAPTGRYQLTAAAIDDSGARTVSDPVEITVGRPVNDDFANRISLSGIPVAITSSNIAATGEPGEPLHAGYSGQHSVWWSWTPPISGNYIISTEGSSFPTLLGVYVGGSASTLAPIASDVYGGEDHTSRTHFDATRGKTYQIAVDGLYGSSGRIVLRISPTPPPDNDRFADRVVLNGTRVIMSGNNANAGSDTGEPNLFDNSPTKTVWWTWVAPASGIVTIDTSGSSFDTLLSVYSGTGISNLFPVASDDDSGGNLTSLVAFPARANGVYHIAVDGFSGASGDIHLNINLVRSLLQIATWKNDRGVFGLKVGGGDGQSVLLEASSDLLNWLPISTNTVIGGFVNFTDNRSTGFPYRFYRAALDFTLPPFAITNWTFQSNQFTLRLSGREGDQVTIQTSSDLQVWAPIATNRITGGVLTVSDLVTTNYPQRFYRALRGQ